MESANHLYLLFTDNITLLKNKERAKGYNYTGALSNEAMDHRGDNGNSDSELGKLLKFHCVEKKKKSYWAPSGHLLFKQMAIHRCNQLAAYIILEL